MAKKADNKDYDTYVVKVDRHDKQGKDVSGDRLGKGGRHRKDGTYSSVAYDFKDYDEDQARRDKEELDELRAEKEQREYDAMFNNDDEDDDYEYSSYDPNDNPYVQMAQAIAVLAQNIQELVITAIEFDREHPEVREGISKGLKKGWKNISKLAGKARADIVGMQIKVPQVKIGSKGLKFSLKTINNNKGVTVAAKTVVKSTDKKRTDGKKEKISIEEARRIAIEILANYIEMRRSFERLKNAEIEGNDNTLKGIEFDDVMKALDAEIKMYPELLDRNTENKIRALLKKNKDDAENEKIIKALGINNK